jgi:ABC-type Fe3+-hydroxamate transport system substrate-binding protein
VRTFCPIWMKPLMTIHGATFISDLLALAGAENVFSGRERHYPLAADLGASAPWAAARVGDRDIRYPRVRMEEVNLRAPELILLPDEPHPFSEEDADVFRREPTPAAERGAIVRTDGKDICWYGARSVEGLPRVRELVDRWRTGM